MTRTPPISITPKTPTDVSKALVYIILTAFAALQVAQTDGTVSIVEILTTVVGVVGLIPVYLLAGTWVKTAAAFVLAALQALIVIFVGGAGDFGSLGFSDWVSVALAAFAAIGIAVVPNTNPIDAKKTGDVYNVTSLAGDSEKAIADRVAAAVVAAVPIATVEYVGDDESPRHAE
jgi:hypothetical protein